MVGSYHGASFWLAWIYFGLHGLFLNFCFPNWFIATLYYFYRYLHGQHIFKLVPPKINRIIVVVIYIVCIVYAAIQPIEIPAFLKPITDFIQSIVKFLWNKLFKCTCFNGVGQKEKVMNSFGILFMVEIQNWNPFQYWSILS